MCAGGGEKSLRRAGMFFYPAAAQGGKSAVAADLVIVDRLRHVLGSLRSAGWNIKINHTQSFFFFIDTVLLSVRLSGRRIAESIIANFLSVVYPFSGCCRGVSGRNKRG